MLLETFYNFEDDIIIYSENIFDYENNFKFIYKNKEKKLSQNINSIDVSNYVKNPGQKNIILYRLLTNENSLKTYNSKYGFFVNHNNSLEIFYFDPIFAIKDLIYLKSDLNKEDFKFRIQQVGLTSKNKLGIEAIYQEVFSFNMRAVEAKNQSDKVFVDALFAFNKNYNNVELSDNLSSKVNNENNINDLSNIVEEANNENLVFNKLNNFDIELVKKNNFSNFIEKYKNIEENNNKNIVEHFDFGILAERLKEIKKNDSEKYNLTIKTNK